MLEGGKEGRRRKREQSWRERVVGARGEEDVRIHHNRKGTKMCTADRAESIQGR